MRLAAYILLAIGAVAAVAWLFAFFTYDPHRKTSDLHDLIGSISLLVWVPCLFAGMVMLGALRT